MQEDLWEAAFPVGTEVCFTLSEAARRFHLMGSITFVHWINIVVKIYIICYIDFNLSLLLYDVLSCRVYLLMSVG